LRRPLLDNDFLDGEHLKDFIEVIVEVRGEYDPRTGEWSESQEKVVWSGWGSIQPYIQMSLDAIPNPTGGIALMMDTFRIFLPPEALRRGMGGFVLRSGNRYFEPKHDALDPGGQRDYWVVIAAEVNRAGASVSRRS